MSSFKRIIFDCGFGVDSTGTGSFIKKNSRKSPLVPRQMNSAVCFPSSGPPSSNVSNPFHLPVSSHTISKLEDLILEGDSLEVSLDETLHIGRILQVIYFPSLIWFYIFLFIFRRIIPIWFWFFFFCIEYIGCAIAVGATGYGIGVEEQRSRP